MHKNFYGEYSQWWEGGGDIDIPITLPALHPLSLSLQILFKYREYTINAKPRRRRKKLAIHNSSHSYLFFVYSIAIVMVAQKGKIGWRRFHNCGRMHFSFKDFRRMTVHTGHWCWWCTRMHYLHQWSDPPFFVIISSSVLTCENRTIWGDLTQFLFPIQLQLNKYLSELCSDATIVCNICGINLFGNIQLDNWYISLQHFVPTYFPFSFMKSTKIR